MSHTPLGEVFQALGLLSPEQVTAILDRVRVGARSRFGEVAVEMGFIDDEGLARGLAQQFRLNMVPPDRLRRLSIAPEVLDLLPRGLMRERLVLPTFLDEEKRVLSLLTVDPTDIASLRAAQTAARAARLRLFVAPRGAIRELIARLLPADDGEPVGARATVAVEGDRGETGSTVIFEPDPDRAAALRAVEKVDGGGGEVVGDLEQVKAFVEANHADRLFFRRALLRDVEPYVAGWRKLRPLLQICAIDGFAPSRRVGLSYQRTRDFFFGLLEYLVVGDGEDGRARRELSLDLVRAMSEHVGLPAEHRDAVLLAAILVELADSLSSDQGVDEAGRVSWVADLVRPWGSPYDLQGLFNALVPRLRGESGPGSHVGAEILYSARAAARHGVRPGVDPLLALGADAAHHDASALRALEAVLSRAAGGTLSALSASGKGGAALPEAAGPPAQLGTRRKLGRAGPPPAMTGRLAQLPLIDVLQLLVNAGRTACVVVSGATEPGELQIREGRLVAATCGVRMGQGALRPLVGAREGSFEVYFDDSGLTNLTGATEFLLLEALRLSDEDGG